MGKQQSNPQWTTYRILDATIMNVDVAAAADIGVGKLNHTAVLTDNNSGTLSWICAAGSSSAGAAGGITTGAGHGSNNVGGTLTLTAGVSIGSGTGAKVDINAGAGGTTGIGGAVEITAGAAGGGDKAGGAVDIDAGAGQGSEPGGAVLINAGAAGATGTGGAVTITSGTAIAGAGGAIGITASPGVGGNNVGGDVTIIAGASIGSGTGGDIQLTPGDSATGTAGSVLVGANSAGHDVKIFGATSGAYLEWDASVDTLNLVKAGIALTDTFATKIQIGGTYDHGIRFTEDPVAGDVTNSFINIGDYTTGIAVAPTSANMFGVMHNVTFAVNVAYWYQAYYTKITTSGTTTSSSIAGHAYRLVVASDLVACYGVQSHINLSGARTFTSEVSPGSFYLDVGTGSVSAAGNRVNALQAVVTGGATVTANYTVAEFAAATNAAVDSLVCLRSSASVTATSALWMQIDGTVTYAFDFQGTVSDGWTTATAGTSVTPSAEYVLIPVDVVGTSNPLFLLAAQTWTAA